MATEKNVFLNLNSDASPLRMPNGSAKDMLNVRVTETACYNVKGTALRFAELPEGENTCIGAYEDKQGDTVVFFIHNSNGAHSIHRFFPQDNTTELLLEWNGLNFSLDYLINSEVAMVDNLLFWTDGLNEIRQINVTKKTLYDSIKATDTYFANLIKRPPVHPLRLTDSTDDYGSSRINDGSSASQIAEHNVQLTYRYVYDDNEKSVFAPFSLVSPIPFSEVERQYNSVYFQVPAEEVLPPMVKRIEYAARLDNSGGLYIFKTEETPFTTFNSSGLFKNDRILETIPEEEAVQLFDSVPLIADTLTLARNRVFVASYKEGYDAFDTLDMVITPEVVGQSGVAYGDKIHKSHSTIKFGLQARDYAGRTFGVMTKPDWVYTTPDITKAGGIWTGFVKQLTLDIDGTVPAWVDTLQVVATKSQNYSFFIDGFGYLVFDYGEWESNRILGQFGFYQPFKVFVRIESLVDRGIGYVYEDGDYVNIKFNDAMPDGTEVIPEPGDPGSYNWFTGTTFPDNIKTLSNCRIIGQQGDLLQVEIPAGLSDYLKVAYIKYVDQKREENGTFNADTGWDTYLALYGNFLNSVLFEIFRPNQDRETYYELGKAFHPTGTTINETLVLKGDVTLVENTQLNDKEYVNYFFNNGKNSVAAWDKDHPDMPTFSVFWPYMEAMSAYDRLYTLWPQHTGRPTIVIPDAKQVYKRNYERFSNKYLSGTQINGLNSFEGLNEKDLPIENGPINKLVLASNTQAEGTVLLAIMQNETESQYLGEAQWRDTQGNTTTAISSQVIGSNNTMRGGYGTINPESVVVHNGTVYWWDATKGEPVRYSQDGITPLATMTGMREFFYNLSREQLKRKDSVKVFGGYDPYNHEYLMHFTDAEDFTGLTIAFNIRMKGFTTRYSFRPEQFIKSNTLFYSFKNGALWEHDATELTNNFYDTQYNSSIRFISNQEPHLVKVWKSIAIEGETVWVPTAMLNDKGQESYMKADWFGNREGMFYGAIRRDVNSKGFTGPNATILALNNGDDLRSTYLDITIENDSTTLTRLDAVNVIYIASSGHNSIT